MYITLSNGDPLSADLMDKGGLSFYFIIDDENYANLARIFNEIYILELFLNKIKKDGIK